jgi:hypothetical protein
VVSGITSIKTEDVEYDFRVADRDLLPAMKPMLENFRAAGGDPHLLNPVLGADPLYLQAALDEMKTRYGSIESYFAQGLGSTRRTAGATQRADSARLIRIGLGQCPGMSLEPGDRNLDWGWHRGAKRPLGRDQDRPL